MDTVWKNTFLSMVSVCTVYEECMVYVWQVYGYYTNKHVGANSH